LNRLNFQSFTRQQIITVLVMVFVCLMLALKLAAVFRDPPHWDAGYYLDLALNFLESGQLTPRMWRIDRDMNLLTGGAGGYGALILPAWVSVFGASLLSGRMLMYVCGLLSLGLVYWIANRWWGQAEAQWAAGYAVCGTMFFYSFVIRMDALAILSYSVTLAVHIYAVRQEKPWLHFLVGVLAILTTEFHAIGLAFAGGLAFYYGVSQVGLWWKERRLVWFPGFLGYFAGALLAGLAYLAVHVLPNPTVYFLIRNNCLICETPGLLTELRRIAYWVTYTPIEFFLLVIALYSLLRHPTPSNRHFLLIFIGMALGYAAISPPISLVYFSHLWPLFALAVGAFAAHATQEHRVVMSSILLAVGVVLVGMRVYETANGSLRNGSFPVNQEIVEYIEENYPPDTVILAPPTYYIEMIPYRNFLTIHHDLTYTVRLHHETVLDLLEREAPEVIVLEQPQVIPDEVMDAVLAYAARHPFKEAMPNVWVLEEPGDPD
jgi:hypothetical protein